VQGKSNKMVASAIPLSHHMSSKDSLNSINLFSYWQLQYKLSDLISD